MYKLINKDNFAAIKHSSDIQVISSPLIALGISYFNHIRIYQNGARLSFGNHGDWLEHFFKNEYYNDGYFSKNAHALKDNYILWCTLPYNHVMFVARNEFNISNGFTIVKRYKDYVEFYLFASTRDNSEVNNFYINNLDVLQRFIAFYTTKAHDIIKTCKPDVPILKQTSVSNIDEPELSTNEDYRKTFFSETDLKKYIFNCGLNEVNLSKRQYQCVQLLLQHNTIKGIADKLKISQKTCYKYFENIKNKFSCSTQDQLIKIIKNLNL